MIKTDLDVSEGLWGESETHIEGGHWGTWRRRVRKHSIAALSSNYVAMQVWDFVRFWDFGNRNMEGLPDLQGPFTTLFDSTVMRKDRKQKVRYWMPTSQEAADKG